MNVTDSSSGISKIDFRIYDKTAQLQVYNGTAQVIERDADEESFDRNKRVSCFAYYWISAYILSRKSVLSFLGFSFKVNSNKVPITGQGCYHSLSCDITRSTVLMCVYVNNDFVRIMLTTGSTGGM